MRNLLSGRDVLVICLVVAATCTALPVAAAEVPGLPPPSSVVPKPQPLAPSPYTLEERYLDAARRADQRVLQLCLDKGADLRAKDGFGRSALLLAIRDGHSLEIAKLLQARGLAIDDPDGGGRSPLHDAAANGDLRAVSWLLESGAKVDRRDFRGQTPLYNAVLGGSRDCVARLLAAGSDANTADQFGDTPLIGACDKGNDDIARYLVEKGADPSKKDQEGRSAMERANESSTYCRALASGQGVASPDGGKSKP